MLQNYVYGIYADGEKANAAIERLRSSGFDILEAHAITDSDEQWVKANPHRNSDAMKTVYAGTALGLGVGELLGFATGWGIGPGFALTVATAGGAAGAAAGAMIGSKLAERDKDALAEYKGRGVLVSVRCDEADQSRVIKILDETHALSHRALPIPTEGVEMK